MLTQKKCCIALAVFLINAGYSWQLFSMEGVESTIVREAAEEAGVVGAESLGRGEAEALTREVADSMGVSVEDIKNLPEDTRAEFKEQLVKALKEGDVTAIKDGKFVTESPESFRTFLSRAKGDFADRVQLIAKEGGLPSMSRETLEKFGVQANIFEKFPIKAPAPEIPGLQVEAKAPNAPEVKINEGQDALAEANANKTYVDNSGQVELEPKVNKELASAKEKLDTAFKENIQAKTDNLNEQVKVLGQDKASVESVQKEGNPQKALEAKDKLQEQEVKTENAAQEKKLSERQSSKAKYEQANKEYEDAIAKRKHAQEELTEAKKKGWSEEVVKSKEDALKTTQENERATYEEYQTAKKEWIEKSGYFEAVGLKIKEKALTTFKEHIINSIVSGFAFAIPNFVIGPIQEAMNRKAQLDQLRAPQSFGTIWMQIPFSLINDGAPLSSYPVYVGINQQSGAEVSKRNDDADTDTFLKAGNYYVSISDYGEVVPTAITDPSFPFRMLHLNTGYHFINDGLPADADNPTVALLKADPRARTKSVQTYLDGLAGNVRHGVTGAVYEESREQATGYKGNPTIADLFDKNDSILYTIPPDEKYGSILSPAIAVLENGSAFGPYRLLGFTALTDDQIKQLTSGSITKALIPNYPYPAFSIPPAGNVYQTKDTPEIRAIIKQLGSDNPIANVVMDYVVLSDPENPNTLAPLLVPSPIGSPYGTPSYQLTPNYRTMKMVSLISGSAYTFDGQSSKVDPSALAALIDPNIAKQVEAMKRVYDEQWTTVSENLKYGPFKIGIAQLSIDKNLAEKGIFVYKIDSPTIENGINDYVVPIVLDESKKPVVGQLPNDNVQFFVSVITSRFYDKMLQPAQQKVSFFVYKTPAGSFMLQSSSKENSDLGKTLFKGEKIPLYTLFMDPEVNPNKPTPAQQKILVDAGAKTADGTPTTASKVLPLPNQWALSDQGLFVDYANNLRLGSFIEQKAPELRTQINRIFTQWKNDVLKDPSLIKIELGPFRFTTDLVENILLYATSVDDIRNGNYIYTSAQWPEEYLVLADDKDGNINLGAEYNLASPQRYAISLSNGNVYDAQNAGQVVNIIADLDQLLQRAQRTKSFSPALLQKIKATQGAYRENLAQKQFNEDTMFGRFRFFIALNDLKNGCYVYGEATDVKDPLKLNPQELKKRITNYFVTIEGAVQDDTQWVYGRKLSENTTLVVSLVSGALYDRGGSFQGNLHLFDPKLNTAQGVLETIFKYIETTWGANSPCIDSLKARIIPLTEGVFKQLEQERKQIAQEREAEEKIYAPLSANMIANIKVTPYVQDLLDMPIPRYLKLLGDGNYYYESPEPKEGEALTPKVFMSYNVGDAGKDSGVGMSYDEKGSPLARFTGWTLANMRAYAGIAVGNDGKQTLDIASDHPSIPVDSMIKLDVAAIGKVLAMQRVNLSNAHAQLLKNPLDKAASRAFMDAAYNYNITRLAAESAQAVKAANIRSSGQLSYEFYFNPAVKSYFVKVISAGKQYYYDLVGGYGYNIDGTPRIRENQVFVNEDLKKGDYLFVGIDGNGLLIAALKGDDRNYHIWSSVKSSERSLDGKTLKYTLGDDQARTMILLQVLNDDGTVKKYSAWLVAPNGKDVKQIGTYLPGTIYSSLLRYARTNNAYIKADVPTKPIMVVWDGSQSFNLKYLFYDGNLIPLQSSGADQYIGNYKKEDGSISSITIKKQRKSYSDAVTAHWITITQDGRAIDYVFDTMILDPDEPTKCEVNIFEKQKLNYWKQCAWKLNVITDSRGLTRLVHNMPTTENLQSVDISMIHGVPAGKDVQNILSNSLNSLFYDSVNNRFVYQLGANDKGFAYFQDKMNGWYVDLATGVVFDPTMATIGVYPVSALLASQLDTLLARLNLSVSDVENENGVPGYDQFGNPIMRNNKQVKLAPGLVYRTPVSKTNLPKPAAVKKQASVKNTSPGVRKPAMPKVQQKAKAIRLTR
jgi:hypothetical protein